MRISQTKCPSKSPEKSELCPEKAGSVGDVFQMVGENGLTEEFADSLEPDGREKFRNFLKESENIEEQGSTNSPAYPVFLCSPVR
jgi:hypothetical protein